MLEWEASSDRDLQQPRLAPRWPAVLMSSRLTWRGDSLPNQRTRFEELDLSTT